MYEKNIEMYERGGGGQNPLIAELSGFTLAEVLITLAIIGVVAILTVPSLLSKIQVREKERRIQNITSKIGQATDSMVVLDAMNGHTSTMDFVHELSKFLKIIQICDTNNIVKCWPSDTIFLTNTATWEVKNTTTGKSLKMINDDTHEWSDTTALVTADGIPFIISYNKKCNMNRYTVPAWANSKSSSSNCVAGIFDWNGNRNPNTLKDDVILFNANGLGGDVAFEINGKKFMSSLVLETKIDFSECSGGASTYPAPAVGEYSQLGIKQCYVQDDYWAAAVKHCGGIQNMPTQGDLEAIASELYGTKISGDETTGLTFNKDKAIEMGLPTERFLVMSDQEGGSGWSMFVRVFDMTETSWGWSRRRYNTFYTLCVAK